MINLNQVKKNKQVLEFIKQSDESLAAAGYTEHSLSHAKVVSAGQWQLLRKLVF